MFEPVAQRLRKKKSVRLVHHGGVATSHPPACSQSRSRDALLSWCIDRVTHQTQTVEQHLMELSEISQNAEI